MIKLKGLLRGHNNKYNSINQANNYIELKYKQNLVSKQEICYVKSSTIIVYYYIKIYYL